ncbi:MAG: bifunctional chorismate mutase/prephenate dehydratase [Ruminococcaceae bacterium]|nr:bifunctional chorismate mutase/prephenate dehydratase [Oscillospiraceae bacterium]
MNSLEKARKIINTADKEMAKYFEMRMDAVKLVTEYKRENGIPIDDFAREAEMIERNSSLIENEEYREYYVNFLKSNILLSKKMQHKLLNGMTVAYSGVEGAFANICAQKIFPDAKCVAYADFKAAYRAVEKGECDCVLLPIENSHNGDVGNVLDLAFFGSLYINGVYEADIVQNLLAVKGAVIDDVKKVISHPQALGQSANFIEKHNFETENVVNTAVAAKMVAEMGRKDIAAIGSAEAAEKYGLNVLASHINESNTNTTRFAVFSRSKRNPSASDDRFIMLFTVKNVAGSLGRAISVIGEHGFNLHALKSRPTKELVWDYFFYVEGEGNVNSDQGRAMLEDLKECCSNLKIVGNFEKEIRI